jgi:hypothetical protein
MLLDLGQEQLGVLRRALEARARDLHLRLGGDPGDEGFRREAALAVQLLRQVEALARPAGYRAWDIGRMSLDRKRMRPEGNNRGTDLLASCDLS